MKKILSVILLIGSAIADPRLTLDEKLLLEEKQVDDLIYKVYKNEINSEGIKNRIDILTLDGVLLYRDIDVMMDRCPDERDYLKLYPKDIILLCSQSDHKHYKLLLIHKGKILDALSLYQEKPSITMHNDALYIDTVREWYLPQGGRAYLPTILKFNFNQPYLQFGFAPSYDAFTNRKYRENFHRTQQFVSSQIDTDWYKAFENSRALQLAIAISNISSSGGDRCEFLQDLEIYALITKWKDLISEVQEKLNLPRLDLSKCVTDSAQ